MSKITFRADDDLIRRLEEFDASKSEVMRDALREYLDGANESDDSPAREAANADTLEDMIAERVDALIADRLDRTFTPRQPQDINVNIALDSDSAATADTESDAVNVKSDASDAAEKVLWWGLDSRTEQMSAEAPPDNVLFEWYTHLSTLPLYSHKHPPCNLIFWHHPTNQYFFVLFEW